MFTAVASNKMTSLQDILFVLQNLRDKSGKKEIIYPRLENDVMSLISTNLSTLQPNNAALALDFPRVINMLWILKQQAMQNILIINQLGANLRANGLLSAMDNLNRACQLYREITMEIENLSQQMILNQREVIRTAVEVIQRVALLLSKIQAAQRALLVSQSLISRSKPNLQLLLVKPGNLETGNSEMIATMLQSPASSGYESMQSPDLEYFSNLATPPPYPQSSTWQQSYSFEEIQRHNLWNTEFSTIHYQNRNLLDLDYNMTHQWGFQMAPVPPQTEGENKYLYRSLYDRLKGEEITLDYSMRKCNCCKFEFSVPLREECREKSN